MAKASRLPLTDRELSALFSVFSGMRCLVAAVSGGPDSMSLMAALVRWREATGDKCRIVVATVDHGLRPDSAADTAMVAQEAQRRGLDFRLLHWKGDKPRTGIQEAARNARYQLLVALCEEVAADALVTAHTIDDQAETMLMRLARGSGLSGLCGMAASRVRDGVLHVRPFLGIAKCRLIASCRAWDVPFVEDPSNHNLLFTRARWRKLLPELAHEGLDAERLAKLAGRLARVDDALEAYAQEVLQRVTVESAGGALRLDARQLCAAPEEIAVRVVSCVLAHFGKGADQVRLQRIEDYVESIGEAVAKGVVLRRTLAGVMLSLDRGGLLSVQAEPVRRRGRAANLPA